ncbi:MAG: glycosyl transferase family 51, partial [Solirubrobacterales bacterium]|nr:glycosyl transferase family 51 [Solirubrobacterales bacterium]
MSRRYRQRRRDRSKGRPVRRVIALFVMVVAVAVGGVGAYAATWVLGVLNETPDIASYKPKPQGAISTIYAADGTRLGFISSDILRTEVGGRLIPDVVKKATVAIEDRRFFEHGGVDYVGVARAAVKNVASDSAAQGGSTLTMQLVRNLYVPGDRFSKTLTRKVREAKLANELEDQHTKNWILDAYLNNVPYGTVGGQTAVGIQAASRIFFDKPASRLTLAEGALLAGLPQAPSDDNPFEHPKRATRRRSEVLRAMVTAKDITPAEAAKAAAQPLGVKANTFYQQRRESFFFDYVKQELIKRYGAATIQAGGLKVYTTIDLKLQEKARQAIADHLNQPDQPSAALVTIDPDNGHILAMASSATYGKTVFNYATQAFRQPGSTFKAIDLMAAVREGVSPDSTYYNSHELTPGWDSEAPTWHVATDDHVYSGSISLSEAMAKSDNTVYAQLGQDVGMTNVRQTAYDMGVTSHLDAYPAESIGGLSKGVSALEMANAYATIANGGVRHRATALEKVVLADGTVQHPGRGRGTRKFTDGETSVVTKALKTVLDHGTAAGLGTGCPAAGKTGTTSSFTDAWFVGYTPRLSTAVWVGYPKETTSMTAVPGYGEVFGATIPGPIWSQFMKSAKGSYCNDFPEPKTPFVSRPFDGKYLTQGRGLPSQDPNGTTGTDPNATGGATTNTPRDGAKNGTTNNGNTTGAGNGAAGTGTGTSTPAP